MVLVASLNSDMMEDQKICRMMIFKVSTDKSSSTFNVLDYVVLSTRGTTGDQYSNPPEKIKTSDTLVSYC